MSCSAAREFAVALPPASLRGLLPKAATAHFEVAKFKAVLIQQCANFVDCRHWRVKCNEERMNMQDDEGTRTYSVVVARDKGMGPGSAGQAGDTQGLSDVAEAGAESVKELVEEGQSFEAEVISGVEDAPDPDVDEVHAKQVPEDDVPSEYLGRG
jgi:hypothetical protein